MTAVAGSWLPVQSNKTKILTPMLLNLQLVTCNQQLQFQQQATEAPPFTINQ